mgnify:FL=1
MVESAVAMRWPSSAAVKEPGRAAAERKARCIAAGVTDGACSAGGGSSAPLPLNRERMPIGPRVQAPSSAGAEGAGGAENKGQRVDDL